MKDFPNILEGVLQRRDLNATGMAKVMQAIMSGTLSQVQLAAFLMAMRAKGTNATELSSAAKVMRDLSTKVKVADDLHLIDTCGSGGDGLNTFNISTACAFVAAAGGAKVAKHGNKAVSSSSGSADLLRAAGAELELSVPQLTTALAELGFAFIFAPLHHQAMRFVAPVRQELKVKTIFNILGPLTNPAGCTRQLLGIFSLDYLRLYAETLQQLGSQHVLAVHAAEGLDEISCAGTTHCVELKDGVISEFKLKPADFGLTPQPLELITCSSVAESLVLLRAGLAGEHQAATMVIALNAGAALYVAGKAAKLEEGVTLAQELLASGAALQKFEDYINWSKNLAGTAALV